MAHHSLPPRPRRARLGGHVADPDRPSRRGARPPRALALCHRHAAVPAARLLDRPRHDGHGHGRARSGDPRSSTATRSAPISPASRSAATAPGSWPAFTRIAGRPSPSPRAASSGAMHRSAGSRHQLCPRSTPTPWAAHPSGSSTAARTTSCPPRESELMFDALKAAGGHVRLWLYQGLQARLLDPRLQRAGAAPLAARAPAPPARREPLPAFAERIVIPLHPPAIKLPAAELDSLAGEYREHERPLAITIFRQGDPLYEKNRYGESTSWPPSRPRSSSIPTAPAFTRFIFERDRAGPCHRPGLPDDRHEERWERRTGATSR